MNIQQIADYEASLQFALGDILRDLTILMHCAEQEQWLDDATYLQTLTHLKTFQNRLNALEQDVRSIYGSTCNLDNDTDEIILS